ncbi:MAG: carbamoyltransferase HypF [Bacillota bacterium]|nr:carbamoyltransferase HypF [Bacillota bacterium]
MSANKKQTEKIKLWGIVQGVGFRPFVAKVADKLSMKGEVLNIGGLVEITVTDYPERIQEFIDVIYAQKPVPAEIVHVKRSVIDDREFDAFHIIKSDEGDDEAAMIPADLAICPHCLEELYDKHDPRYQHPFISCMICGPRYTIIDRIPYDRHNTTMVDYPMCDFCDEQYNDLHDRRHHAQTISCHECGPHLIWRDLETLNDENLTMMSEYLSGGPDFLSIDPKDDAAILDRAAEILRDGGILAFKSVGGYNLVADPFNNKAVAKLRQAKNRESKPFAVMFRSLDEIRKYCHVGDVEARLLESSARPIILLEHKLDEMAEDIRYNDLKRSRFIGSFLPSFAAQYMLLDRISPLIFTSANLSDMPMIKDDDEMMRLIDRLNRGQRLISGVLYNKRRIQVRADDSVTRVIDNQPQMIRRSKGYAPVPLYCSAASASAKPKSFLAAGPQLKNSFALTKGGFIYVSQYFGDMDTIENQQVYEENVTRMGDLFRIRPEAVVCDMHPLYYTTAFAEKYAAAHGLPLLHVQHHHAHVASVMAENDLDGPVIGVSFDGTGYGNDGRIWGGEFLLCEKGDMQRISHLKYVDMIGGDSSMKDAVRSALSFVSAYQSKRMDEASLSDDGSREILLDISDIIAFGQQRLLRLPASELIMKAIKSGVNTVQSSSMGRLFDGVSSLLGIKDYNDYEGQCAIMLEDAAAFAQKHPGEFENCDLALSFHERVIDMILSECRFIRDKYGVTKVALTGGTFQNKILMEGVLTKLRAFGFEPYYNVSVSPNDGGIALGQAYVAMHKEV